MKIAFWFTRLKSFEIVDKRIEDRKVNGHRPPNQQNGQPVYIGFEQPSDNTPVNQAQISQAQAAAAQAQAAATQAQAAQSQAAQAQAQAAAAQAAANQAHVQAYQAPPSPPPAAIYIPAHAGYRTRQNVVASSHPETGIHFPKKKRANFFGMLGTAIAAGAFAIPAAPVLAAGALCSTLGLLFHRRWWAFLGLILVFCNPGTHQLVHRAMDPHNARKYAEERATGHQLRLTNISLLEAAKLVEEKYIENGDVWPNDIDGNVLIDGMKDSWGSQIRYDEMERELVLRSPGPDRRYETEDDVVKPVFQAPPGETIMTSTSTK